MVSSLFLIPLEFQQLALPSSRMERMIVVHPPTIAAMAQANAAALLLAVLVQQYHKHTALSPAVSCLAAVDQRTWRWSIEPNQSLLDVRTRVRYASVVPETAIPSKMLAISINCAEIMTRFVLGGFQALNDCLKIGRVCSQWLKIHCGGSPKSPNKHTAEHLNETDSHITHGQQAGCRFVERSKGVHVKDRLIFV